MPPSRIRAGLQKNVPAKTAIAAVNLNRADKVIQSVRQTSLG
jgi:hypothetical protein